MALPQAVMGNAGPGDWATPSDLFKKLDAEFHFTLDVCAQRHNAKCRRFFSPKRDGLKQSWAAETCWMNPPYGRGVVERWVRKAYVESRTLCTIVVCLLKVSTDTAWWHDYAMKGEIRFLRGRVKFLRPDGKPVGSPPFASAVVIFR